MERRDKYVTNNSQQLEQENRRLKRAVDELSVLNEIATAISSTQNLEQIIDKIVEKCVKHLHVQQAVVNLLDENAKVQQLNTMVRRVDTSAVIPLRLDTELTGWMIKNQKPLLSNDLQSDRRFSFSKTEEAGICSVLSAPMCLKGHIIGLITCFNKKSIEGFDAEDQRLLSIIATQSAQTIENARLREKEQDLLRIEEEFRLAHDIQTGLLPKSSPYIKGYDITGISLPARIVGGDYFDYIQIDACRYAFCLGDISGKGLPAAVLMANLQATIRGLTLSDPLPEQCLAHANTMLYRNTAPSKFATFFYGILNFETHEFTYGNAGHNRPVLVAESGEIRTLQTAGLALGFLEKAAYSSETVHFNSGDSLVAYSDGVTEAMNATNDEFGEEQLVELLKANCKQAVQEMEKRIIKAVDKHSRYQLQSDDITLMILKRMG
jgi:sigma-B regulation protein RsbU (phosphoserine phosphatase)